MKNLSVLVLAFLFTYCNSKKEPIYGETAWQQQMNADFKDATKSPLKDTDRKNFKTLNFYKTDSAFVVKAYLQKTPNSEWFFMKTTTDRVTEERVYGILHFYLKNKKHQLQVYQSKDLMQKPEYIDYLFLPFLDNTNGNTTYSGGRYLELSIPKGDSITIDFNKAYNPYCAYNEKYSCPIVPIENFIDESIEAGVKAFKKY